MTPPITDFTLPAAGSAPNGYWVRREEAPLRRRAGAAPASGGVELFR